MQKPRGAGSTKHQDVITDASSECWGAVISHEVPFEPVLRTFAGSVLSSSLGLGSWFEKNSIFFYGHDEKTAVDPIPFAFTPIFFALSRGYRLLMLLRMREIGD